MHITLFLCASTGHVYISSLILNFFNVFCLGFLLFFVFFKVNSGDFLHNRLLTIRLIGCAVCAPEVAGVTFSDCNFPPVPKLYIMIQV